MIKRRARTTEDKQKKGDRILQAAKELFFDHGYYGTTIEMITAKAGVSTGTLYLYFKNKIEIYKALQDEGLDILLDIFEDVISRPGISAKEKLTELAHTYLGYYREYREYFDIIAILGATPNELKETDTELSKIINTKAYNVLKKIEGVMMEGVRREEFVLMDTWKATSVFWGLMDGLVLLDERENIENVIGFGLDDLLKQALEMSFYGIIKK